VRSAERAGGGAGAGGGVGERDGVLRRQREVRPDGVDDRHVEGDRRSDRVQRGSLRCVDGGADGGSPGEAVRSGRVGTGEPTVGAVDGGGERAEGAARGVERVGGRDTDGTGGAVRGGGGVRAAGGAHARGAGGAVRGAGAELSGAERARQPAGPSSDRSRGG